MILTGARLQKAGAGVIFRAFPQRIHPMTRDAVRLRTRAGGLSDLLRLAGPVVLGRLGIMAMGLTDTIVVGRYSATQLGYHALGWAPTGVILTTAVGLLNGVQVMTSRTMGEGRPELTGAVLRRGLVYALWIGVACAAVLYLLGPALLVSLGLEADLARGAGRVVQVFALSLPMFLVASAATSFLEGLGRPTPGMLAMWAANIVNLALNLLLVPGAFGLPAMGALGAAWATFAARGALMAALIVYILAMPRARALGVFRRPEPDPRGASEQRRIGYGAGLSLFMESGAFAAMSVVAGWLGGLAVAAWAVVLNVVSVIFMVPLGLATATSVLVAHAYGARDPRAVVHAGKLGFAVCSAAAAVIALAVWPTAPLITRAYATDPLLIRLASGALVLSCLFLVADALQVVAAMALRARGDVWVPTITQFVSYALIMLPLGWALAFPAGLGFNGIIWAVIAASVVSASLLLGRFWLLARRTL